VIEVEGLTRRYHDVLAVDGVSFRVAPGELLVLVGESGSGKTTTLKMINRLVEPTAGRVLVDGQDARAAEPHALRRRIGYVFQRIGLFPHMTVAENVAVPLRLAGWSRERMRARVAEVLTLVELDPALGDRRPRELSGGQQQRVAVARSLAMKPALVLADEPTGNLDTQSADGVFEVLRKVNRDSGTTFLIVTHDPRLARRCDRIIELVDGRIVADRPNSPSDG
jgi:osmoprotectant transport system ATP-binding protein